MTENEDTPKYNIELTIDELLGIYLISNMGLTSYDMDEMVAKVMLKDDSKWEHYNELFRSYKDMAVDIKQYNVGKAAIDKIDYFREIISTYISNLKSNDDSSNV